MSDQLSFFGEGTKRPPTDGLFFAAFPPTATATAFSQVGEQQKSGHGLRGRLHAAERLHLSLIAIGEFAGLPQRLVETVCAGAATIPFAPFELCFDRVESFFGKPGSYPLVLRCGDGLAQLMVLHRMLGLALKTAGLAQRLKPLDAPHVTLMYADRRIETQAIAPIRWTVTEFVLVHSLLGRTIYQPLGRWPLRGPGD